MRNAELGKFGVGRMRPKSHAPGYRTTGIQDKNMPAMLVSDGVVAPIDQVAFLNRTVPKINCAAEALHFGEEPVVAVRVPRRTLEGARNNG